MAHETGVGGVGAGPDRLTLAAFVGVALIGGGNGIAVKQSVAELAPFWSAGLRFVAAGILMAALVVLSRRPIPTGLSLAGAAAYGAIGFGGSFGLIYPALREVPAGTAMVLLALVPLETFGLAIAQRQERFHVQGLIGALIALVGIAIVFADQLSADVSLISLLLVVGGTFFVAESGVLLKWIPRSDPFSTNAVAMLVAAAVLLLFSFLGGEARALPARSETWIAIGYLVVLGSVVLFGLYLFALRRWTASALSYVTLLMPLVGVPLAVLLLGEGITLSFFIGAIAVVVGVYVGAFLNIRPRRTSATSLPECLPIDACAEPASVPVPTRSAS
ncbi:MAG: EamA family transporter [Chloroflexota bacterium]